MTRSRTSTPTPGWDAACAGAPSRRNWTTRRSASTSSPRSPITRARSFDGESAGPVSPLEGVHAVPDDGLTPDETAAKREDSQIARDVLSSLPPRRRAVMLLRYGWGLEPQPGLRSGQGTLARAYRKEITRGVDELAKKLRQVQSGEWCSDREPLLKAYAAGVADDEQRLQAQQHLSHCRHCTDFVGRLSGHLPRHRKRGGDPHCGRGPRRRALLARGSRGRSRSSGEGVGSGCILPSIDRRSPGGLRSDDQRLERRTWRRRRGHGPPGQDCRGRDRRQAGDRVLGGRAGGLGVPCHRCCAGGAPWPGRRFEAGQTGRHCEAHGSRDEGSNRAARCSSRRERASGPSTGP